MSAIKPVEQLGLVEVLKEDLSNVAQAAMVLKLAHITNQPREVFVEAQASLSSAMSLMASHCLGFCFVDLPEHRMDEFLTKLLPPMVAQWRQEVRDNVDAKIKAEKGDEGLAFLRDAPAEGGVQ